jgi:crotonobetainyl-CoA:carnitine CoA-transferase CaiB-like acyl-CoA transferase
MTVDGLASATGDGPLQGRRVADLSGAIGAYCTKLLADLEADVIKVEPPRGDPMREAPPLLDDGAETGLVSAVLAAYHVNKRGVTLDISRREALPALASLAASCDVIVVSPTLRGPVAGLNPEDRTVSWAPANCIIASITPFGLSGPLRDMRMTPFLSFALGGGMHWTGDRDGPPLAAPGQLTWDEAGIHAALGIVAALGGPDRPGRQLLDLSVHEVAAAKDFLTERFDVGSIGEFGRSIGIGIPPTGCWNCSDGPLGISAHQKRHWEAFLTMLDHPDVLSEPSLADTMMRRQIFDGLGETIAGLMATRSRMELFEKGQAAGLPCAPFNKPGEFVEDIQTRARHVFASPEDGEGVAVAIPWRWFHSTPTMIRLARPAPHLGQHNEEIYSKDLGISGAELDQWKASGLV